MRVLLIVGALALGACTPMTSPTPTEPGENACRASEYSYLIGRNRSDIPQTPAGATWRVTCSSCAVTMDYNPNRLNITYDDATGRVENVRCG